MLDQFNSAVSPTAVVPNFNESHFEPVPLPFKTKRVSAAQLPKREAVPSSSLLRASDAVLPYPASNGSGVKLLTRRHSSDGPTQNRGGISRRSSDGDGSKFCSYERSKKSQESVMNIKIIATRRGIQNAKDHGDTKVASLKKAMTSIQHKGGKEAAVTKVGKEVSAKRGRRASNVQAKHSSSRYDVPWNSDGCCVYHPSICLAVKKGGVWDLLTEECPECKIDL